MKIKNFTIYGERCSGTNYLQQLMMVNFAITNTWKYCTPKKHFFGFYDFQQSVDEDETLFIGIVRNPIDWLYSFYCNPHHLPKENKLLDAFLNNEYYSVDVNGEVVKNDLNYVTGEKYKNIFEMRKMKNDYLINIMPGKVKNYILINYEDLTKNTAKILHTISRTFEIPLKSDSITNILYYKDQPKKVYIPRDVHFSNEIMELISRQVDKEQENLLGYF